MFQYKSFLLKAGLFGLCLAFVSAPVMAQPEWVQSGDHPLFNHRTHLTAVGSGHSRHAAEMDALGRLVIQIRAGVRVDERMIYSYRQAVQRGVITDWTQYTDMSRSTVIAGSVDNLIGAEIPETWGNGRGTYFALAVLNRARATQIYVERIRANQDVIRNLTNMSAAERNTFDGFARYQLAAAIAEINHSYGIVLSGIGSPQYAQGLVRGEVFEVWAQEIRRAIPIGINVRNDRDGRIHGAFARAFSELGFMTTGGTNTRYILDVDISIRSNSNFSQFFGRYMTSAYKTLRADLRDTRTGSVFLPFNFTESDSSMLNQRDAENRALLLVEQRINNEYRNLLSEHLSRLIPER